MALPSTEDDGYGHELNLAQFEPSNGEVLADSSHLDQQRGKPTWRRLRQRLFSLSGPASPDGADREDPKGLSGGRLRSKSSAQEKERLRGQQFDDFLNLAANPAESSGPASGPAATLLPTLTPSSSATDRRSVPKIDISAAQQWSRTQSVSLQGTLPYVQDQHNHQDVLFNPATFYTKPRRRPGLAVSFSAAAPEVIGQGGDEAPEPPAELATARWKLKAGAFAQESAFNSQIPPQNAANPMHARVMRKAVPPTLRAYSHGEPTLPQSQSYSPKAPQPPAQPTQQQPKSDPLSGPLLTLPVPDIQERGPRRVSEADAPHVRAAAAMAVAGAANPQDHSGTPYHSEAQRNSPLRGLRRMRAEEGRTLVSASQRHRLSVPDGMSLSHGWSSSDGTSVIASTNAPSSLQVVPSRLSFESDRTSSHQSTASIQSLSDHIPHDGEFDTTSPLAEMQRTKYDGVSHGGNKSANTSANFCQNPLVIEFADRVEHLKSVFRLSAQLRKASSPATEYDWTRTALWWFLRAVTVVEDIVQERRRHGFSESLSQSSQAFAFQMQSLVNLSKTWFILSEVYPELHSVQTDSDSQILEDLRQNFLHLIRVLQHEQLMPPGNPLIQGLDTSLWVNEPEYKAEKGSLSLSNLSLDDLFPLGDSEATFYYNRAFVQLQLSSRVKQLDQIPFTGLTSMMRSKSNQQISLAITSPHLVGIIVSGHPLDHITWQQVRWERDKCSLRINVGQGLRLNVTFHSPRDFHTLLGLFDYGCRIMAGLKPRDDERLLATLAFRAFEYSDTAHPQAFSPNRAVHCPAMLFERITSRFEGYKEHRIHRGHRLVVLSGREERHLKCVSVGLDQTAPLVYEAHTAEGEATLKLRIEQRERRRILGMTFHSEDELLHLRDWLTGDGLAVSEQLLERLPLKSFDVVPLDIDAALTGPERLAWNSLDIVIPRPESQHSNILSSDTDTKATRRFILRHANGSFVDHADHAPYRLSLDPAVQSSISLLRSHPQQEATLAVGPHPASQHDLAATHSLSGVLFPTSPHSTVRTYTFPTLDHLHAFQRIASTGVGETATVLFDIILPSFAVPLPAHATNEDPSLAPSRRRKAAGLITSALRKGDAKLRGSIPSQEDFVGTRARIQLLSLSPSTATTADRYLVAFFEEGHPFGASAVFHLPAPSENIVLTSDGQSVRLHSGTLLTPSVSEHSIASFASLDVRGEQRQMPLQDPLLHFNSVNGMFLLCKSTVYTGDRD